MPMFTQTLVSQMVRGTGIIASPDAGERNAEQHLLLNAAREYLQACAGYQAATVQQNKLQHCPPDTGAYCPPAVLHFHELMTRHEMYSELLPEFLLKVAENKLRIPEELLPYWLQVDEVTAPLLEAIRGRGAWLGRQQFHPAFFDSADEVIAFTDEDWHSSNPAQRFVYFQHVRATDPDKARELLRASWSGETFGARENFLRTMAVNLSLADEDFLEARLAEYQHELFVYVLQLLYDLPGSRVRETLQRRVGHQVRFSRNNCSIYTSHEEDAVISTSGYHIFLGEAMRIISPGFWMHRWEISAEELIRAGQDYPGSVPLVDVWYESAIRTGDVDFARAALLQMGDDMSGQIIHDLARILPPTICREVAIYWLVNSRHTNLSGNWMANSRQRVMSNPASLILGQYDAIIWDDDLATLYIKRLHDIFSSTPRPVLRSMLRRTIKARQQHVFL